MLLIRTDHLVCLHSNIVEPYRMNHLQYHQPNLKYIYQQFIIHKQLCLSLFRLQFLLVTTQEVGKYLMHANAQLQLIVL